MISYRIDNGPTVIINIQQHYNNRGIQSLGLGFETAGEEPHDDRLEEADHQDEVLAGARAVVGRVVGTARSLQVGIEALQLDKSDRVSIEQGRGRPQTHKHTKK